MPELSWGAASDTGRVRSNNEDNLFVSDGLFVVADGMGGHRGGEVASQIAVAALRANFSDQTVDGLIEAVRRANDAVFSHATDDPDLRGMGTTLVALAPIDEDDDTALAVVNVGDSRMYLFRDGELERVTEDHSLVEEMVRDGRISPDEALTHPRRNIVTRALGIDDNVEVDGYPVVPYKGDRFVLCSDGLYDEVDDARIAATLRRFADPGEAANELVRLANDSGGHDNISVIVVDVVDDGGRAEGASKALARDRRTTTSASSPDLAGFTAEAPARPAGAARVEPESRPEPEPPRPRRLTWRVAVFVLVLLVVLAGAAGAIGWYARKSFHVGFDGDQVTIFKGRQGGLLWFDPTVVERTGIARADVPPARLRQLEDGNEVASLDEARRYVANLQDQIDALDPPTTTTTTTTPTASSTSSGATTTAAPPP